MKPKTVGRSGDANHVTLSHQIKGLPAHSIILTLDGERRVRDLSPGQRIVTRDSGTALLRAIRQRTVLVPLIRIRAGSLGDTRPDCDTILPAGQGVLVRDWRALALFGANQAIVAAGRLVDGEFITRTAPQQTTICELVFDRSHILYVDGLEVAGHVAASALAA
ncbi:Hint domain-containing protein [Roseovarius sp. CAU 1744]|uniref:Hint domain-containing protein n=1 Tax=Roseovarius sp. CAU 1744 TaxID=3140368 RepID=UPI00325B3AC6